MRIAVASDHRGLAVKERIVKLLERFGHEVMDMGPYHNSPVDYPDFGLAVAEAVARGQCERGILVCGTGIGMCIVANKVPGVRAAPCHDDITAELSRRHNDSNVLCLSADLLGQRLIDRMIEIWLSTPFDGGRHARRLQKIADVERKYMIASRPQDVASLSRPPYVLPIPTEASTMETSKDQSERSD